MTDTEKITVFFADDHAMVREGLAALAGKDPAVEVVGQTGDGLGVVERIQELRPTVAVLDIAMPGLNGLDVCREITKRTDGTSVLILTMHDDEQFIATALQNGASGYLLKEASAQQLVAALHRVAQGEIFLGPGIPKTVLTLVGNRPDDPYEKLTNRERQVLQLIGEGKTNRQIADQLNLAVKTIDTHRTRLMRKLNIHDQTSLVKYCLQRGIISLS